MTDKYTIDQVDEHKAIVVTLHDGYRLGIDYPREKLMQLFDGLSEAYHFVIDFTALRPTIEDLIRTASATARGESPLLKHDNIDRIFIITHNSVVKLAAQGLNTLPFGNVDVQVRSSLQDVYDELARGTG